MYHNDDGYCQSACDALNLALDKAVEIVDAALRTHTKLGDDDKWAAVLTDKLAAELDPTIIRQIKHCDADRHYKGTMTRIIVDYLGIMRKFIFESA